MSAALNGGFTVLVGHRDFPSAKKAASELYGAIRGHPSLQAVSLEVDDSLVGRFREFLFENRYRCLPPQTLKELEEGNAERIAADAFQVVSSPLSVGALSHIELDPFLLSHRALQSFLGSGMLNSMAVGVKDGVLAAESGGRWYVLLSFRLKEGGVSTRARGQVVPVVYSLAEGIRQRTPAVQFVYSGVPFHAYQSASRAQTEIAAISAVATALLVGVVLLLFFSFMPLAATFLTMGLGIAAGLAATFAAFREVHLFTIVFGTSLIGISVDYAVVFFAEWLNPREPRTGPAIIRRILSGITIGLVTTLVSYLILLFAPFPLLRQMAVFSTVGLISTFLSVVCLFPLLKAPRLPRRNIPILVLSAVLRVYDRFFALRSWLRWGLLGLAAAAAVLGLARVRPVNDLKALYKMSPRLMEAEAKAAAVLELGISGLYYLVRGSDTEDTLRKEEALTARLEGAVAEGRVGGYIATSTMLPSRARQELSYRLVGAALMPRAGKQMQALGFDAAALAALEADYRGQAGQYLDGSRLFTLPFSPLTRSLWIGDAGGQTFSAVLLLRVQDKESLRVLAGELPGITLVNKVEDIGRTLQRLAAIALVLIALAYALIFAGLWRTYDLRTAVKVSAVPVSASILTVAILGYAGLPFNLFAIVGLILVPGIGSDYALFYEEGRTRRAVTMLAVTLSLVSTVSSFGALAFSSLAGVFGLTVTLGVVLSFLLSPLAARRSRS
jgi:predicted exporter